MTDSLSPRDFANLRSNGDYQVFNRGDRFVEGWYWALPSHHLKRGQVKPLNLLGRELALYRGMGGTVVAVDAYCPHMGAHLAEGRVAGDDLRCFFHNWKYAANGACIEVPSLGKALPVRLKTWHTAEQYGMIWVWTGDTPTAPPPTVPELAQVECDSLLGSHFVKNCHPNVVMINAIDAHHFNTVHNLPLEIVFDCQTVNRSAITFSNITRGGEASRLIRLIRPLYREAVTYSLCYWYGSTGSVTLGPDRLHFYILFALRMLAGGKTEGQTILITPRRSGAIGGWVNRHLLWLTQQVGNYFASGDTQIFQTIQFDLKTPIQADQSIVQFIDHLEQQPPRDWASWHPLRSPPIRSSCEI